jgi:hypothetical protein
LAQGDVSRFDKVTKLGVHKCMMYLEYEKEKAETENKIFKQQTR